jgi:hypothetical protein
VSIQKKKKFNYLKKIFLFLKINEFKKKKLTKNEKDPKRFSVKISQVVKWATKLKHFFWVLDFVETRNHLGVVVVVV